MNLRQIGNSKGIMISAKQLQQLGWDEQTNLEISIVENKLVVKRATPSLSELLQTVPEDWAAEELDWGVDQGNEVSK
jgi:antitoxin component of MazEF toxin-antitoxin module